MPSKQLKINQRNKDSLFNGKQSISLFPPIINLSLLRTDTSLPLLKCDHSKIINNKVDIFFKLTFEDAGVFVYLFLNNKKTDMYYSVSAGEYVFKSVSLGKGKNLVELFYLVRMMKSQSTFLTLSC